jgi:hypothetical protein
MAVPISDHEAIQNTLARYAMVVDEHKWEDMGYVFTEDVRVNFTFLGAAGDLHSISSVLGFIQRAATNTVSQHAISTQQINLTGPRSAEATTYMTVMHVGGDKHKQKGEMFCSWGKLVDKLTKESTDDGGSWRITERFIYEQLPSTGSLKLI